MSNKTATLDPQIIDCPEQVPDWDAWDDRVRKTVIGKLDNEKTLALPSLPEDLAERFKHLTHLHLWGIADLAALPELPKDLQCLELRNCPDLERLPELPEGLETLDLGGCAGLERLPGKAPASLTRFYFDGCAGLKSHRLSAFLEDLADSKSPLVEIDGSGTPAVTTLEEFPHTVLRKLVLRNCPKLIAADGLGDFPELEHLNLSGCTGLRELPDLPVGLRHLVLHGAENLALFQGQDIGPYDRGEENQNVAPFFVSRKKFGHQLAVMPHAKLLLMGDGRVGKSTLAKRLQWEELGEKNQSKPANEFLKPSKDEPFTHRVRFWRWETGLSLPDEQAADLDQRAAAAGVALPKTGDGDLDGAVRLWDFGGQEIYHSTHRIFAGEGSIFLVVWRAEEPEIGDPPEDVTPEEWTEWNRQRPLDYWLDYIYSMRPDAQVALVCTHCAEPDQTAQKTDWRTRAPKHAHRELTSFFVDSLDENCGRHQDYRRLVKWIREACGSEARRIGILQPRFYRQVSDLLDRWLTENSRARHHDRPGGHLLCPWETWRKSVANAYHDDPAIERSDLEESDVITITDYLHEAGHLFQIRQQAHRAILVDQEWAADLIYQLLLCGGNLRRTVKRNGGWFYRADLEEDPLWKTLEDDLQRERLLAYMEECRVVTRIADAGRQRFGQDVFLASEKWLLPTYDNVEDQIERQTTRLRGRKGLVEREKFEFEELTISEFDFRALQSLAAGTFGTRAIYFRNGFQAIEEGEVPSWRFRLRFLENEGDPFSGKIDGVLEAKADRIDGLAEEIEDLFYADGSPIAHQRRPIHREPAESRDLGHAFFRGLRRDEYDVAVSSSGADRAEAEALVDALETAGFAVNWYRREHCRLDDREGVLNFMNSLSRQPCIILLLSEGYLNDDPAKNWYCAWELADAIRQLADSRRSAAQTLAVYKKTAGLTSSSLNETIVPLLGTMGNFLADAYGKVPGRDRRNFEYYDQFSKHFFDALDGSKCQRFFEARGTLGSYLVVPEDIGKPDAFRAIIDAVEKATGKTKPRDGG